MLGPASDSALYSASFRRWTSINIGLTVLVRRPYLFGLMQY